MVVGFTIFKMNGNPFYSPSFPRGGQAGVFAWDVTHLRGSPTLTFTIEHRNSEDTSWSTAGTLGSVDTVGPKNVDIEGLKEIVRIKYTFAGEDDELYAAHIVAQAPSFRPYA